MCRIQALQILWQCIVYKFRNYLLIKLNSNYLTQLFGIFFHPVHLHVLKLVSTFEKTLFLGQIRPWKEFWISICYERCEDMKKFYDNELCNHRSFPYLDKQELMQGSYPAIFISSNNLRINSLPMVMLSLKMRKCVHREFIKRLFVITSIQQIWIVSKLILCTC